MAGFLAAAAPYAIPAGLSIAQGLMGSRQAKRDQQRMEEQEKQNKLIQSFNPQAQPTRQQASQPGIGQKLLNDPITQQLIGDLVGQIGKPATGGMGGMPPAAKDAMRQYDINANARRRSMFGG